MRSPSAFKPYRAIAVVVWLTASTPWSLPAQCPNGSPPPCQAPGGRALAPAPNSIAVLYFDNLSRDTADAYLADGLTEELIARLGQIDRLILASRTAVRRYRGRALDDPATLGRALGVAYLVNGSVRRSASRLRVTVELVRAASGLRVWGDQYDRTDADLLAIEEEVAGAVAAPIAGRLAPGERASLATRPTRNSAAYDHFLRGNYYLLPRTAHSLGQAISEYAAAGRLDPHFAAPHARSALAYAVLLTNGMEYGGLVPDSLLARGLQAADLALRQDSAASDAWMAWGYLTAVRETRGFGAARAALARAITLDPRNAEAYHIYGLVLQFSGHDSAAAAADRRALALEPDRAITLTALGSNAFGGRAYSEALHWLDSAVTIDPMFFRAYAMRARVRLQLGDVAGARRDAEATAQTGPTDSSLGQGVLALVEARAGDTVAARGRVDRLLRDAPSPRAWGFLQSSRYTLSGALIALGEHERALGYLEQLRPRSSFLWVQLRAPEFDAIRTHPRFRVLVEESRPAPAPE